MDKDISCWELSLPMVQMAINQTVQPALNVSAFYALFGQHPHTMLDNLTSEEVTERQDDSLGKLEIDKVNVLPKTQSNVNAHFDPMETAFPTDPLQFEKQIENEMKVLRQNILKNKTDSAEVYRKNYNKRTKAEASEYPVGSLVLVQSPPRESKLFPKYQGPMVILKIAQFAPEAPRSYLLQSLKTGKIHAGLISGDRLKKYYVRNNIDIPVVSKNKDVPQSADANRLVDNVKPSAGCHNANGRTTVKTAIGRHNAKYNAQCSDANNRNDHLTRPHYKMTGTDVARQNAVSAQQRPAYNNSCNFRKMRPVQNRIVENSCLRRPF